MNDHPSISPAIQALRTIHYALILSPLLFAVGVVFYFESLTGGGDGPSENAQLAGWVLLAVAVANTGAAVMLRPVFFRRVADPRGEEGGLAAYRAATILFCALLESAALVLLVAALMTGSLMPFVPVVMVPMAVGLANAPSERHYRELRGDQSD